MIQVPLALADRHHVQQRLGGVAVAAVTGVDDRNAAVAGRAQRCALLGVAHGGNVCHTADHADGIGYGLALGGAGNTGIGEAQHLTAQVQHGRLKRKTGTGARFVEQCCQPLTGSYIFIGSRVIMDTVCKVHQAERFFQREIRRVDQMSHTQSPLFTLFIPNGAVPFKIKSACAPSQSQRNPYSRSGNKAPACRCGNSRSHPAAKAPAPGAAPAGGGCRAPPVRRAASSASR